MWIVQKLKVLILPESKIIKKQANAYNLCHVEGDQYEVKFTIRCNRSFVSDAYCENKKAIDTLNTGEILEVQVTDKGALADISCLGKSWRS